MGKKKTQEQFEKEIKDLVGNEYTFLETYKNSITKIKIRHNTCGNEYYIAPKQFLKGNRCRKCVYKEQALKNTKPLSYINEKLKKVHGKEYSIIGNYKNVNTKVLVRHNLCGNEYMVRPDSLLKGSKCKKCLHDRYRKEYTKTTDKFRKEVNDKTLGEYELVSEYKGVYEPIEIKHNICGKTYKTKPYKFILGNRCHYCNYSKGEKLVEQALLDLNISFESQKIFPNLLDINNLSYDFYIPKYNLLIEYQGIQHYEPVEIFGGVETFKKQINHDNIKKEYAINNGYDLLEISYKVNNYENAKKVIENKVINIVKQGTTNQN